MFYTLSEICPIYTAQLSEALADDEMCCKYAITDTFSSKLCQVLSDDGWSLTECNRMQ